MADRGFIRVPCELLARADLTAPAILVASTIASLERMRSRPAFDADEIGKFMGWPKRNVQRALAQLLEAGLVELDAVPDRRVRKYKMRAASGAHLEEECAPEAAHISAPEAAHISAPEAAHRCAPLLTEFRAGSGAHLESDTVLVLVEDSFEDGVQAAAASTVEALELVAPTAHAVAARRSVKRADADRELMNAARKATEAAYRRAHEPFPGGALAWNSSEWRQLAQWARSAAEVGLDIGRRYDVEAVLVAAIDASVAADPQKPIGFWRHRLNETWKQIRNRVPFERVEARADDSRRAAP